MQEHSLLSASDGILHEIVQIRHLNEIIVDIIKYYRRQKSYKKPNNKYGLCNKPFIGIHTSSLR